MQDNFKYVFGPALSRRLGRSLGVDVVPMKTCTYDCVYCQLGRTPEPTLARKAYVPLRDVLAEVERRLASGVAADYVTVAGSGEPTLYSELGALIAGIKAITRTPIAVITNGSLLWEPEVRQSLLEAGLVMPPLDAARADVFAQVNRPAQGIEFDTMIDGLAEFRKEFHGAIWLEVFLLGGVTADDAGMAEFAKHIARICPDRIQLNTVARPSPGGRAVPVPRDDMERFAKLLGSKAEVIARYDAVPEEAFADVGPGDVLGVIQRHPCSLEDISAGFGMHPSEAAKHVQHLLERDAIRIEARDGMDFYIAQ